MPLALHQPTPFETPSPSFKPGRKLSVVALAVLWQRLDEDPLCPSRVLLDHLAQHQRGVQVSVRHLNRLRRQWQRHRPKGRPRPPRPGTVQETPSTALVQVTPHLARVGVHLFARWLEQQGRLTPLVHALQQAIDAYQRDHRGDESQSSDDDFALLHHREARSYVACKPYSSPHFWASSGSVNSTPMRRLWKQSSAKATKVRP